MIHTFVDQPRVGWTFETQLIPWWTIQFHMSSELRSGFLIIGNRKIGWRLKE